MDNLQYRDLLLNQSKDLIWVVDNELQLVYANDSFLKQMKKVTGVEKELNTPVLVEGFAFGTVEKWKRYYNRALNGELFEIEEPFYQPITNDLSYWQVSFKPLVNEDKQIIAISCESRDVTKLVKLRSESQQLMDASLDVFCTINEEGNFVYVSKAARKHWGYKPEELSGVAFRSLLLEEDIPKTDTIAEEIVSGVDIRSFINRYKRKDGEIAYNLWSARWDENAKLMYCVARDGKEHVEKEEIILKSEQRFKSLVQEGADMISIVDVSGNYKYVSPTTTGILGITPEEFVGNSAYDFIHPDDIERSAEYMERISTEKKVVVEPFRLRDGNNKWRWIETVLTNMLDNPAVHGIVANSRDITTKIEEQQRSKLLESVVTNTNDAVLITEAEPFDEPGPRIIYVNEAFTKMTGYTAEEIYGKTPRILQGPKSDYQELAKLSKALRNWEPCEITTINYKKNGEEFWINFSVSPVANEVGWFTHWVAIERDVTEQKNKELENQLIAQISENFTLENDFEKATKELCKAIASYGEVDWVELWTINLENTQMQLSNHYLSNPEDDVIYSSKSHLKTFNKDEGLIGKVWHKGEQILWQDLSQAIDFVRKDFAKNIGLKSVLGVPLIFDNEVLGVLTVGIKRNSGYLKNYLNIFQRLEKFIGSELHRKTLEIELSLLFDTIPDIISVGDFNGRFLRINKPGCELLGYSEEEILLKSFEEFIHPDDLNICYTELQQLQNGQDIFGFEVRFITKSGETLWLSWYCKAKIKEGLIYCSAKNITEEKKLRELNSQTRKLARIGSWEVNIVNQSIYWSEEVHKMHETDTQSFKPTMERAVEFYRKDFRELVNQSIEKSINTGEPFDFEAVLVTSKKKELWVRAIGNAEFVNGTCTRIYGSFQDINDSKEAELRLQSLADNLPGVVFQYYIYTDGTDALKFVTKGAKEIWGFTPEEVLVDNQLVWNQIVAGGQFEEVQRSISTSIELKKNWNARWKYILPNGEERIHLGLGTPVFLVDGTIKFHSMILDVTQEIKNEELLDDVSKLAKIGTWEIDFINENHFESSTIYEILELEPQESIPGMMSVIEFARDDYQDKMKLYFENCLSLGDPFDFEAVLVSAKKNEKSVRIIGSPKIIDGKCTKIIGSMQDISSLKETERRLQAISNNLPGVVYQYLIFPDGTDQLRFVSGSVEQLWGFTAEQVLDNINLIWEQVKAGGQFEEVQASIAESIKTKSKWTSIIKYMMPNGQLHTHLGNGVPIFLADGTIVFNSIILDVTQEAKNERALEQTTTIAKIGSWEMNLANQNKEGMYWSPMIYKILLLDSSYNPSYSAGLELIVDESKTRIKQAMDDLMDEGKEYDEEVQMHTGKGYVKWVRIIGKCEWVNNQIIKIYGSLQDIDEKKTAEEQMLSLLGERNDILESIGDAFFAVDNNWVVTYWNRVAEMVLGTKKEDIVGKNLWEVYADAIGTEFYTRYHIALKKMEIQNFEAFYETTSQWVEVTAYPSKEGLSVYFKDITQRKIANAEIAKSEEKRRLIMNGALDAIITFDSNEAITFWNPQAEVIFGWKEEEIMGKSLSELITPDHFRNNHIEGLKNYLNTGEGKSLSVLTELSAIRKNEEEFPIELTVIPIKQGDEEFFCAFIRDITQHKKAQREIQKANDRFEKVAEATADAIWDWNILDNTLYWGSGFTTLFGHDESGKSSSLQSWTENVHLDDVERVTNSLNKTIEDNQTFWTEEYRFKRKNGSYAFVVDRGVVIKNSRGLPARMVGAITDISDRKLHEIELLSINRKLNIQTKELQRSNKELEQFAFIASHDLQEPLRMISSFMDQLKRKYSDRLDEKGLQYIYFATDGAKRMKQIILDLLLYSRANKPTEQDELINLNEIISEYTQLRRKVITEKMATITINGLPSIETYQAPITQIFHALLDNALKYVDEHKSPNIEINAIEKENVWQFSISDNGVGIDPKFHDKIFIIFQRLQNRKEDDGTGIGLAIAKRSVEFLGGEIWVESEIDEGSTFYFTISKIKQRI